MCRSLTEEPSGPVGGVDWDSSVSHLASAALTVWHPQWLLCTFRAWIAGVGGSRVLTGSFPQRPALPVLESLPVSRQSGPGPLFATLWQAARPKVAKS